MWERTLQATEYSRIKKQAMESIWGTSRLTTPANVVFSSQAGRQSQLDRKLGVGKPGESSQLGGRNQGRCGNCH